MSLCSWLGKLFDSVPATKEEEFVVYIDKIPTYGQRGEHVAILQRALFLKGYKIVADGQFGPATKAAVQTFQKSFGSAGTGVIGQLTLAKLGIRVGTKPVEQTGSAPVNPAYVEAKKYIGKKETDSAWNKKLSAYWSKAGLPGYKTIIGSSFAWCGLFIFMLNTELGMKVVNNSFRAKEWASYGQHVNWKANGIPQGAVMHINSNSCTSGTGNHVTFADGACTPEYLATKSAVVPGYGGNQNNSVRRSLYSISKVCAVRWPPELPLPPRVTKNVSCGSGSDTGESTR